MRIAVVQVIAADEKSESGRLCKNWADLIRRNLDLVKQENTEFTFIFPRWGLTGHEAFFYSYLHHLNDKETLHSVVHAEREGSDAVMITCFYDPMLRDLRQAVDIPVVSLGESSMLMASMMGAKFGVVTISPEAAHDFQSNIVKYGLEKRAVPVRPIPETAEQQLEALKDVHHTIEAFKKVSRELIRDGAEVIIPGCGLMCPALRIAPGAEEEYPNGLTEVDGVPVMDALGITLKTAETLVSLRQAGSCWISRKAFFTRPTPKALELSQMVLKYEGPGFWHY